VEEPEKVREPLAATRTEKRSQTFCAGQGAERELMPGLFERIQMVERPLPVGGVALYGIDDDYSVQIVQHSWSSRRGAATSVVQFPVPLGVLDESRIVFGAQVRCQPPREPPGALLGCDLPDDVRQATRRGAWPEDTNRHAHRAGRQPRLLCQSQLAVRL
jgi:hypothetical protein